MGHLAGGEDWRQSAGQKAQQQGKTFEKVIQARLEVAQQIGIVAWWQHNQPRAERRGRAIFMAGRSGADFSGTFMGGLSFALECKDIALDKDGTQKRFNRAQILETQERHLEATAHGGGLAVLALSWELEERPGLRAIYVIAWRKVPWRKLRSADSLGAGELEEFRRDEFNDLFISDFTQRCSTCRTVWFKPEFATRALPIACGCPTAER